MGKRDSWLFGFAVLGALAALVKILEYFHISSGDLGRSVKIPNPLSIGPFTWAVMLLVISSGLLLMRFCFMRHDKRLVQAQSKQGATIPRWIAALSLIVFVLVVALIGLAIYRRSLVYADFRDIFDHHPELGWPISDESPTKTAIIYTDNALIIWVEAIKSHLAIDTSDQTHTHWERKITTTYDPEAKYDQVLLRKQHPEIPKDRFPFLPGIAELRYGNPPQFEWVVPYMYNLCQIESYDAPPIVHFQEFKHGFIIGTIPDYAVGTEMEKLYRKRGKLTLRLGNVYVLTEVDGKRYWDFKAMKSAPYCRKDDRLTPPRKTQNGSE